MHEPDNRTPPPSGSDPDWDTIQPTYEAPGARDVVPDMPLIWGARTNAGEWPFHVEAAFNSVGMDYDACIKDIQKNPGKYDAVWQQNQNELQMTGQGGVPTMSFNGEPFFGQDRFNQLFWRLRQNGLTARKVPREPMMARPVRWPSSAGGD